jgi:hypothetical protein
MRRMLAWEIVVVVRVEGFDGDTQPRRMKTTTHRRHEARPRARTPRIRYQARSDRMSTLMSDPDLGLRLWKAQRGLRLPA